MFTNRERQTVQVPCQSHRPKSMPAGAYLKFRNDRGVREIRIGVREFKCIREPPYPVRAGTAPFA